MDAKKTTTSTGFKLSVMTLAIMNVTAVVSLRGPPAEAEAAPFHWEQPAAPAPAGA